MKTKMLWFALVGIFCASMALAQGDPLAKVAAAVRDGKVSVPALLAKYDKLAQKEPKNPQWPLMAAAVADRDESKPLYEKALQLAPNYLPARIGYARYLLRRFDMPSAFAQYQQLTARFAADPQLRLEAVRAAARSGHVPEALTWAGSDVDDRIELVHSLLDNKKFDDAAKQFAELGLDRETRGAALALQGRLEFMSGQAKSDKARQQHGLDLMLQGAAKEPAQLWLYKTFTPYPRESAMQNLQKAGRRPDASQLLAYGVKAFPEEYPLYESVWKDYFTEPKVDYTAERARVQSEAAALLGAHPLSADLLKTVAAGYDMASATEPAAQTRKRLAAEFPYSTPASWQRRGEAVKEKDPARRIALMRKYNEDFLVMPLYHEYFMAIDEAKRPPAELLAAAQLYYDRVPYKYLAAQEIGEVFARRNLYLDQALKWLDGASKSLADEREGVKLNAWDGRMLAVRGKLLLLTGKPQEAEKTLRRILDMKAQGYSNVDNGRTRMYLADVLLAQGKKEEAMEMAAQAYAQSQHYFTPSGDLFRKLYRELKGEKGMDEYLTAREDMFQVAESTGIERGSKVDTQAPDFDLLNVKGGRVSLASLRGKVVVINFWATWCGPCIAELPHFQEFYDKMKDDPGVALFAITTDENRSLVDPFLKKNNYTFPVLFDENVRGKFGVRGIPATFIIDPSGMTRLRMVGFNQNEPLVPYLTKLTAQYRTPQGGQPAAAGVADSFAKTAFNSVDRLPHGGLSEAAWLEAKKKAAVEKLAQLGFAGGGLYYVAMLESTAGRWDSAIEHLKQFIALPASDDQDIKSNMFWAKTKLRDAFIAGGRTREGEQYYASDPLELAMFVFMEKQYPRALKLYEDILATNPPPEQMRRVKGLIILVLEDMEKPELVAARLEQYRPDLNGNQVANILASLSRMYQEAGNQAQADHYTDLLIDLGRTSKEGHGVDGVVAAHIEGIIRRLEQTNNTEALNNFVRRVRTDLANKQEVLAHLDAREQQHAILNQPAKELEIDYVLNGKKTTLHDLHGRVVLLDFFAHWCGPCIAGFPGVRELQQKYEAKGLTVLGISGIYGYYKGVRGLSPDDELKRMDTDFTREYQVTWPMVFAKGKANNTAYGIIYIPHLVLIDRNGVVRFTLPGKGFDEALDGEINQLLAEPARTGANSAKLQ